jgi:hypothetical protein
MSARPFISYAREDQPTAVRLYGDLKAAGLEPWLDLAELLPGQEWAPKIRSAMRAASHVIVLVSTHSVDKAGFVQNETRDALELASSFPPDKIFVIPARLDDTKPKYEKLLELHWVDLFPVYATGLTKMLEALGANSRDSLRAAGPEAEQADGDDPSAGTLVNETTLRMFFASNRFALHLDRKIAAFTLSGGLSELSELSLRAIVDALNVAGLDSIERLEATLREHRDAILRWAEDWLGARDSPVSQGISLTYLGYILICKSGDLQHLKEFLRALHIDSDQGPDAIARQVMRGYEAFVLQR